MAIKNEVAALLVRSMVTTTEERKSVTEAEKLVRGIKFDLFDEESACQLMREIQMSDFSHVVERIGRRHKLPKERQDEMLDGKDAKINDAVHKKFLFKIGETGHLVFFRVTTLKTSSSTIDLALVSYRLNFKMSPERVETSRRKWLLGFIPTGSYTTSVEYHDRNLKQAETTGFQKFFRYTAMQAFITEYPEAKAGLPQLTSS